LLNLLTYLMLDDYTKTDSIHALHRKPRAKE